jgi:hypothetical protein
VGDGWARKGVGAIRVRERGGRDKGARKGWARKGAGETPAFLNESSRPYPESWVGGRKVVGPCRVR